LLCCREEQLDEQVMLKEMLENEIDQHKDALKEQVQLISQKDRTISFLSTKLAEAEKKLM